METALFSPYTIKDVTIKNRIVMSPMCMYSANEDGKATDWHFTHYISRAVGQVGLIIVEATAVKPEGRISENDLGIWSDEHVEGLQKLASGIKKHGTKAAIQLAHAGRKSQVRGEIVAPSPIPFHKASKIPKEMTKEDIERTIDAFKEGAQRAKAAGFEIIELHAAHGYLINEFLSPLTNKRTDEYGGSRENRFRFLKEVTNAVKTVWDGPLFVRISANEYDENGNTMKDFIYYCNELKALGVDLIDCSSGGLIPVHIHTYPGYQVKYAETIKKNVGIPTGAVGLITSPLHAEEILQNERADLVFLGRELLRNPYWPRTAALRLNVPIDAPKQYERGW